MSIRKSPWRWIFLAAILLWAGLIFWMSAAPGTESQSGSDRLTLFFQQLFFRRWESFPEEEYVKLMGHLSFFIRKAAHFTEFAILGSLLSLFFCTFEKGFLFRFFTGFGVGVLYAVSDEVHQLFVEGRDGSVFDVLVDAAGVLMGCLLILGIFAMTLMDRKRREMNHHQNEPEISGSK